MNELERHELYRTVFESPNGELVLKDLADRHKVFSTTFVQGDPHATSHAEGRRLVILDIIRYINLDVEFVKEVMKERDARERRNYSN